MAVLALAWVQSCRVKQLKGYIFSILILIISLFPIFESDVYDEIYSSCLHSAEGRYHIYRKEQCIPCCVQKSCVKICLFHLNYVISWTCNRSRTNTFLWYSFTHKICSKQRIDGNIYFGLYLKNLILHSCCYTIYYSLHIMLNKISLSLSRTFFKNLNNLTI